MTVIDSKMIARFWKHVTIIEPEACWLWNASLDGKGYGQLYSRPGSTPVRAHRVAYMIKCGLESLPADVKVCHKCDNPRCVNPWHLWGGTQKMNMNDMASKGRTGCLKLTNEQVIEVKRLISDGIKGVEIARLYNVTPTLISRIRKGKARA